MSYTLLDEGSIKELKDVFSALDSDNDGSITLADTFSTLVDMGCSFSSSHLSELKTFYFPQSSSLVSFDEFCFYVEQHYHSDHILSTLFQAFNAHDPSDSGLVTIEVFKSIMSAVINNPLEVEKFTQDARVDNSDLIPYKDYLTLLSRS
ncbi:hypothetical protein RCL1_004045 [Eukaryota sp. TZLM3-RCL]